MISVQRRRRLYLVFSFLVLFVALASLFFGRYSLSPGEVIKLFVGKFQGVTSKSAAAQTLWNIRIPRILLNIIVGGGLAAAGATFQGLFQNRLVSPDILGVSSGAGFGAALAILLNFARGFILMLFAFTGGIISVSMTFFLSRLSRRKDVLSLVLSGMIVSSFFSALISFIKLVADTESQLPSITYWLMGSFASITPPKLKVSALLVGIGLVVLFLFRWRLNLLSLGDEEAQAMGVKPRKTRAILIAACTLITAGSVMSTGMIGWVGMIIPNMARSYAGADHVHLLPLSFLMGSVFMLLLDLCARTLTAAEIPIGILTAIVGAPVFAYFYFRHQEV